MINISQNNKVIKIDKDYQKEKFHIQRLASGVRETSKLINNYSNIITKKSSSLTRIIDYTNNTDTLTNSFEGKLLKSMIIIYCIILYL